MLTISEAAALLREFDHVLILTHIRPDGDTVGCAAALCAGLRALGKTAYLLPNPGLTDSTASYFAPYAAPVGFVPDRVVSTDIAALALLPDNARDYGSRIDLVALPLYVAVSTDTGCFAYANTTANTHKVAAALIETGIDYRTVNKVFFRTKTRKRMQLEGAMLAACEFYDRDRVAVLSVPLSLMEQFRASESDAEELSSLGGQIQGVDCAVTMRELRPDVWKLSLRTGERINATEACRILGGGGHAAAAGCTVEAPWTEAKRRILDAVAQVAPDFLR